MKWNSNSISDNFGFIKNIFHSLNFMCFHAKKSEIKLLKILRHVQLYLLVILTYPACQTTTQNLEHHVISSPTKTSDGKFTFHYFAENGHDLNIRIVFDTKDNACGLLSGTNMERSDNHFQKTLDMSDCQLINYEYEVIHKEKKIERVMDKMNIGYRRAGFSYFDRRDYE